MPIAPNSITNGAMHKKQTTKTRPIYLQRARGATIAPTGINMMKVRIMNTIKPKNIKGKNKRNTM